MFFGLGLHLQVGDPRQAALGHEDGGVLRMTRALDKEEGVFWMVFGCLLDVFEMYVEELL